MAHSTQVPYPILVWPRWEAIGVKDSILEIKPFVLKKDRYLFYKGNTLVLNNITNITLMDINNDNSILLQVLKGINLIGKYNIPEGESITTNNLTITNIKSYKRELGYENHAILKIIKD